MRMEWEMTTQTELRTIVVAGCSSGAGKTSVAEKLTEILARFCRTAAAKITVTHGDRGCPHGGKGCNVCSSLGGDFQIVVEDSIISQAGTDTARLMAAGGSPVVWAITRDIALGSAWDEALKYMVDVDCVVVESNSLAEQIEPTLTLMVVDASISRRIWKPSAERLIASADYIVFNERGPKVKREVLLREIECSRGGLDDVIHVSHPHELDGHTELQQRLDTMCSGLVIP